MDVAINDITDVEKELSVEVTVAELTPHFDKAYKRAQSKIEIKGFRKGKVPLDMLKKMYGEQIEQESLDTVASDVYREVAVEKNLRPVGEPVLVDVQYKRGKSFAFKIKYEVLPEIKLKQYKGLLLEKLVHTVNDREMEEEIERIRRANATMIEVSTVDDNEHILTADIQELDETGFPVIGKKSPDQRFYLGDATMPEELRAPLKQAVIGTPLRIKYETTHENHTHKTHIEVTVKKIEKIQLPELNDEFITKVTKEKISGVTEFREKLRTDLQAYWQDRSERKLVNDLIGEISRMHDFAVPEAMVNGILRSEMEELATRFKNKKLPDDFEEEKFREESRPAAVFQAKWYLLRERIIEQEGLKVDDAELEALAKEKAKEIGIEESKLVEFFKQSEETQRRLLSDKLMALLKLESKITEKTTEEPF